MGVPREFSHGHLTTRPVMGYERGTEPRTPRQEHQMQVSKKRGSISNYDGVFPPKKKRHRSYESVTSVEKGGHRVPIQEDPPNEVKHGFSNENTHRRIKYSEQRKYRRGSRIRGGRLSKIKWRNRTHSMTV